MARFRDGVRLPTNLFECAAWHRAIQAICRNHKCRRVGIFDPHQLWWLFHKRGWDDRLQEVERRLKCKQCGGRAAIGTTSGQEANITLPWPNEREWKRAVSRFRS